MGLRKREGRGAVRQVIRTVLRGDRNVFRKYRTRCRARTSPRRAGSFARGSKDRATRLCLAVRRIGRVHEVPLPFSEPGAAAAHVTARVHKAFAHAIAGIMLRAREE